MRADNNVMALFAAARIAKTSVGERAAGVDRPLVGDLYTDEELPYRGGFRLTISEATSRWDTGMDELSRMAMVIGVAALDDLLASFITLLRATGHDESATGSVDTGVSAKLEHLCHHARLDVEQDTLALYHLLVEIRHGVTHHGARQRTVRRAWNLLTSEAQAWWTSAGGRALPLTQDDDELRIGDRELLASLKTMDRVGLEIARGTRAVVTDAQWADLVVAEYRDVNRPKANDPFSNVRRTVRYAWSIWRIRLTGAEASEALSRLTPNALLGVVRPPR